MRRKEGERKGVGEDRLEEVKKKEKRRERDRGRKERRKETFKNSCVFSLSVTYCEVTNNSKT